MGGVDNVRGVNYQHAHAILGSLDLLDDFGLGSMRVEADNDVVDIELYGEPDERSSNGSPLLRAAQVKSRSAPYTWARAELLAVFRRWAALPEASAAAFDLVTNGALGPSGQSVVEALEAARKGDLKPIAQFLDLSETDEITKVMPRVRVRFGASGPEELLLEAEREVRSLLPGRRGQADLKEESEAAVNRLFRLVALKSGCHDPLSRVILPGDVLAAIGSDAAVAKADRWREASRDEYVKGLVTHYSRDEQVPLVIPSFVSDNGPERALSLEGMLHGGLTTVLFGSTGSGKSTALSLLRNLAAQENAPLVLCNVEGYVEGRLDALVADAIGAELSRNVSRIVGRQALSDRSAIIALDGVSEVPRNIRDALAEELRPHLCGGGGARFVLAGRNPGTVAEILPAQSPSNRVFVSAFDRTAQLRIARAVLFASSSGQSSKDEVERVCSRVVAQAAAALGDAVGNPLLLTFAVRLVASGVSFTNRANLYSLTIDQLAHRGNASEVRIACAALGIVFSRLLDEGRRYANPLEWHRLITEAARQLADSGLDVDARSIQRSLDRSGLVSAIVTHVGRTELRGAIHDSFADYLAGTAIAGGFCDTPVRPTPDDEQRLLFATEIMGVSAALGLNVAQTIPFALVRISAFDSRPTSPESKEEIEALVSQVLPPDFEMNVALWISRGHTFAKLSTRIDQAEPREQMVVVEPVEGPTAVAVRLWQAWLRYVLRPSRSLAPPLPGTVGKAVQQLTAHSKEVIGLLDQTVRKAVPPQAFDSVMRLLEPAGITAYVGHSDVDGRPEYLVSYLRSPDVRIEVDGQTESRWPAMNTSSVESITAQSPARDAAGRIAAAINEITTRNWV